MSLASTDTRKMPISRHSARHFDPTSRKQQGGGQERREGNMSRKNPPWWCAGAMPWVSKLVCRRKGALPRLPHARHDAALNQIWTYGRRQAQGIKGEREKERDRKMHRRETEVQRHHHTQRLATLGRGGKRRVSPYIERASHDTQTSWQLARQPMPLGS